MKKNIKFYLIALYIVCFTLVPQIAQAKEGDSALDSGSFTYRVVPAPNQQSPAGYFDLRMKPDQKQTVQIELKNSSSEKEVTVGVSLNSTKTNANGVLEYGPANIETDDSLKHDFTDIVKAPETVTLKPSETALLNLDIAMPTEKYDGFISGGIQLSVVPTEETKKAREKQSGIQNDFAFLIGMLLTESDTEVQPDLSFNKFYAELSNYRNAVFVSLSNTKMGFMKDMTIDMDVMKKGSKEVLYDTKKADMRMAPNSLIKFPLSMNGDEMVPGDYTGHILVTSGDRKWEWTEDFTITNEEADKYNKQDVNLTQEQGIDWKLIAMIVGGVIIVFLVIFFIIRMVMKKNKRKKKSRKISSKKE